MKLKSNHELQRSILDMRVANKYVMNVSIYLNMLFNSQV